MCLVLSLTGCSANSLLVQGNNAYYRGDTNSAVSFFRQALQDPSTRPTAELSLGKIYAEIGEFEKALEHLNSGLSSRPDASLGYFHRALVHTHFQQLDQAERDLRFALLNNPYFPEARLQLSDLYQASGRTDEALEVLRKEPPYFNENYQPHLKRKIALLLSQEKTTEAREACKTYLKFYPDDQEIGEILKRLDGQPEPR